MKRAAPRHPKVGELADRLDLERWGAVGILESMWHFTAQYARQGDIGRWSNARIADGIGWRGDPDALVEALVATSWMDRCQKHRLLVHHWQDHADDSVRKTLKAHSESFCVLEPFANDSRTIPEPFASAVAVAVAIAKPLKNAARSSAEKQISANEAEKKPPKPTKPRPRNLLWDAVVEAFGIKGTESKTVGGRIGKVTRDLKAKEAEPADIPLRLAEYKRRWPDADATPEALVKHWELMAPPPPPPRNALIDANMADIADSAIRRGAPA